MFLSSNYADGLEIRIAELQAENAALSEQLTECQANAPKFLRAQNMQLRRAVQLFEQQLAAAEDERDALRRQLAEAPRDDIAQLYDAYAYATAGWEPGKAESFPAVLRYLFDTQGAE